MILTMKRMIANMKAKAGYREAKHCAIAGETEKAPSRH
jgi:hypothetical protein